MKRSQILKIPSLVLIASIAIGLITGCGEEPKAPLKPEITETDTISTVSERKQSESISAAPQAPNARIPFVKVPFVKKVNYYTDWRLTRPVREIVTPGTTVYTKVVFSEAMQHIAADDKSARPVLYYQIRNKRTRYRVVNHEASKSDFVSGDAKPKGKGTTVFICKYTVQANDKGKFSLAVGKPSADTENNKLAAFYKQADRIRLGKKKQPIADPTKIPEKPHRTRPGTTKFTGRVFFPDTDMTGPGPRLGAKPISGVTVTIASGLYFGESVVTDRDGQYTFHINGDELHLLVRKEGFEPKEVTVYRSRALRLANGSTVSFLEDPQDEPGNILIGHRWPDEVRFILRQTTVVDDLLCAEDLDSPHRLKFGGFYSNGVVVVYSGTLATYAHEIAHAHQHAMVKIVGEWDWRKWPQKTPEGRAFVKARKRDWAEYGKASYDRIPHYSSHLENAAETASYFWINKGSNRDYKLETAAPNRLKWAARWVTY